MQKSLFFDFDGVILNSAHIKTAAFYEMFLQYGEDIAEKALQYHVLHAGVSRYEKFKYYYTELLHKEIDQNELDKLGQAFSDIVLDKILKAPLTPGVVEFLTKNSDNYNCFVVSGTPQDELELIINKRELSSYFKEVFGSPASKIEILERIGEEWGVDKGGSYFLGDAHTDLDAAKKYGVRFILVKHEDNANLVNDADIVISDFTEIKIN